MSPPLTSVHVEISELGARAMGVLLEAVQEKNRHERRQVTLPTTLVVRQSCGGGEQRT
jgi:LacI family transcriptional regulator